MNGVSKFCIRLTGEMRSSYVYIMRMEALRNGKKICYSHRGYIYEEYNSCSRLFCTSIGLFINVGQRVSADIGAIASSG